MLTIRELREFIAYLKCGKFEQDFEIATHEKKEEMLELLETVMDASDLADEVATKLIYRGLPIISGAKH